MVIALDPSENYITLACDGEYISSRLVARAVVLIVAW